jgi:glycosyl hydrolase family 28
VLRSVVRRAASRRLWAAGVATVGLSAAVAGVVFGVGAAHAAVIVDPRDFGALGNGTHNDAPAIQAAVNSASSQGGGTVHFTAGTYLSANTIHLKNRITIQLDSGAKIIGSGAGTYDAPESNPNSAYQDFGHSHFHDAMFYGDGLDSVAFVGSGSIDGNGHLITGNPSSGQADKILSLTRCTNLTLNGITLARGGHFAALINGCDVVNSDHLTIATSSDRDGWNIINTSHATITNITDSSNDDALVFKSDWALGQRFTGQGHVVVKGAKLSARCCNALMFGSETCSDFTDYQFSDITITSAGKSGLGIVSMDGANITNVHYSNVTMSGVASPIMEKIGTRKRCGDSPGIGTISDIHFDGVTGTGKGPYSPTIWGNDSGHRVSNETFNNVNLTVPGGSGTISTGVPSNNPTDYNPNSIGTRPAYGWYIHQASGISYTSSSVRFQNNDARPAVVADNSSGISFDGLTAQRGSGSPTDVLFNTVSGYCVVNSQNTTGGALRVTANSSTKSCSTPPPGLTISGLSVADTTNAADWSVQSNLQVGSTQYGDRTFTVTAVPSALVGKQWIRTANDSKGATNNPLVTFTVNQSATVAVAVDTRIAKPSWMGTSWTDTGTHLTNSESTPRSFEVFTKTFVAGQVALGPNANTGSSMYMIIVF